MDLMQESAAAVQDSNDQAARSLETQAGPESDETLEGWGKAMEQAPALSEGPSPLPHFRAASAALEPKQLLDAMVAVRRFHRGDPDPDQRLESVGSDFMPALLFPFRNPQAIRHDYPLFLFPGLLKDGDPLFEPLPELLRRVLDELAPDPEDARILGDNLVHVEHHIRQAIEGAPAPVDAAEPIREAVAQTASKLGLSAENAERMRIDGDRLLEALPQGGWLLALGPLASLQMFLHVARLRGRARRRGLKAKVDQLRNKLQDQLIVALGKDPEGRQTSTFLGMVGSVGVKHVDPEALGRIIGPQRGAEPMAPERKARIERALGALEKFTSKPEPIFAHVLHHGQIPQAARIELVDWHQIEEDTICKATAEMFDRLAHEYAELFGAMRVAELELSDSYEPERHDALLASFDWEAFTLEELQCVPPVLAVESAQHLAGPGMFCLSRLLLSGRPVNILVPVHAAANVGMPMDADPLLGYRLEIGYLGVSHREAMVSQTSATRPEHLALGFEQGLRGTRTALHVVSCGMREDGKLPSLGSWLYGGAALEGRAHPFFHYNPEAGDGWARRFDFGTNPQPDEDWPTYNLPCLTASGEDMKLSLAFTFADFALAEERYREHFALVPDGCVSDELVPIDEFLRLTDADGYMKVPFIWAVDAEGCLRQLILTRRLAFACRDRLSYWHLLQELAGVRSEHIDRAIREERARLEEEFEKERRELQAKLEAEAEQARLTAADDVLQRLAESLLNTDVSSLAAVAGTRPMPVAPGAAPPTDCDAAAPVAEPAEAPIVVEDDDDDDGPQEPWISSILCTSCNDCMNINRQVFVYNGSKQATIGDARAGTYEELVRAAEKCPSRCIHPGKPLNPDEPNLEELIKRAKPFN